MNGQPRGGMPVLLGLGGCGCLGLAGFGVLMVVAIIVFFVYFSGPEPGPAPTPEPTISGPGPGPGPGPAQGGLLTYECTKDKLGSKASQHFVPFTLQYPDTWKLDDLGEEWFFSGSREEGGNTLEALLITYMVPQGPDADLASWKDLIKKTFPDVEEVGTGTVDWGGGLTGKVLLMEATLKSGGKWWGRAISLPISGKEGLSMLFQATSFSDVKEPSEVAKRGDGAGIFQSIQLK